MRFCYLEVVTYQGYSLDGHHYYGVLRYKYDEIDVVEEVTRFLSSDEAEKINKVSLAARYRKAKEGDIVTRFDSEEDVIEKGIQQFTNRYYEPNVLLILGSDCVAEPQRCLVGPEVMRQTLNRWVDELDRCRENNDEEGAQDILDAYWEMYCD